MSFPSRALLLSSPALRSALPTAARLAPFARNYATPPSHAQQQLDLQAKQTRLAEKAGRMKQNIGVLSTIPVFASYVRPRSTRTVPSGLTWRQRVDYFKADWGNDIYTFYLRYGFRKALGKGWYKTFKARASTAYVVANQASATGIYKHLVPYASSDYISDLKGQRASSLQGLRLNWKLHREVEQEIVCVRQQEIAKLGEFVGQIAVRFVTEQSLEVRNPNGDLLKGNHDVPSRVTEYYVFQRKLWQPEDDWVLIKKVMEIDPFGADKALFVRA